MTSAPDIKLTHYKLTIGNGRLTSDRAFMRRSEAAAAFADASKTHRRVRLEKVTQYTDSEGTFHCDFDVIMENDK